MAEMEVTLMTVVLWTVVMAEGVAAVEVLFIFLQQLLVLLLIIMVEMQALKQEGVQVVRRPLQPVQAIMGKSFRIIFINDLLNLLLIAGVLYPLSFPISLQKLRNKKFHWNGE